ncbi:MAG TPA: PilC/PilY family type IV pilus protein, partial [Burkholderiales bacterium]|nr:PilC/PilY family type IV pilus protein [Burkholderiales bacterium]
YRAAHSSYFDATVLAGLTQWPPASDTSAAADYFRANAPGDNLLGYLRGQFGHELGRLTVPTTPDNQQFFRNRTSVMGDALESQPAFLGAPVFSYPYPGYIQFKTAQSGRIGIVYMGTNDGMLHAFNSSNGVERWAYVPSMVIPNMWKLADQNYQNLHTNYVNGSPITSDVCTANCANAVTGTSTDPVWKTILVGGLNGGGRGYYALDITDPTAPKLLWEFTTTAGNGSTKDDDLGYTYGQAIITQRTDGRWVVAVTSGYNNGNTGPTLAAQSPAGTGIGYLFVLDAGTGQLLSKISTGAGTAGNPSGLAKIGGFNADPGGNKVSYIYGGDLLGNLWRFDINDPASAAIGTGSVLKFATLFSNAGATVSQPIMTTPVLGTILGKRVVFVGTGKYLEPSDLATTQKQTQYAIKDDNVTATIVNPRTQATMVQQYLIDNPDGTSTRLSAASASATAQGSNTVNFGVNLGWFVDFPSSGERANIDAALIQGTLLVPTIVPASSSCSPGGFGWLNFLDYSTGASVVTPGLSGVRVDATIVGLNVLYISGNPVVEVVSSTNPTPTIVPGVQFAATAAGFAGQRVQWRELLQ